MMDVTWKAGAADALKGAGFVKRPGAADEHANQSGLIKRVPGASRANIIQGIHVLFNDGDATRGDMHIDYNFWRHGAVDNDDVTQHYNSYKQWYGAIPGMP